MKILITGICGFVGSAIAKEWLERDARLKIYGIDNLIRPGSEENRTAMQNRGVTLYHGDIRLASDFDTLPEVDWVIDAAANPSVLAGVDGNTSSRQLVEHNLWGTVNILEYCKRYDAGFIMMSTSRVYAIEPLAKLPVKTIGQSFKLIDGPDLPPGISPSGVKETFSTCAPISLYGSTKLASEVIALEYGDTFKFPVWINRCGVLAGAGQFGKADQGIFSYWINAYLRRRQLKYIGFDGNGYQVRDCLHPRDLIDLIQKQTVASQDNSTRLVNIGGGESHAMSLSELSSYCEGRFGHHTIHREVKTRQFDIPWLIMDCQLAKKVWNWEPQTSLLDILDEIARHAEQNPGWLEKSGA